MKTIERLIRISGGLDELESKSFHIYKPPFLPIHVRHRGIGPREYHYISVSQMIPCLDGTEKLESEISFEIAFEDDDVWGWYPVSYCQESPRFSHACIWKRAEGDLFFDLEIHDGINKIAEAWDQILLARGYMDITTTL